MLLDKDLLPGGIEISQEDLEKTPPNVLKLLFYLLEENRQLKKRIEELEAKLNRNSSNSDRPPSSDGLFKRQVEKKKSGSKRLKAIPVKLNRGCISRHRFVCTSHPRSSFLTMLVDLAMCKPCILNTIPDASFTAYVLGSTLVEASLTV